VSIVAMIAVIAVIGLKTARSVSRTASVPALRRKIAQVIRVGGSGVVVPGEFRMMLQEIRPCAITTSQNS